MSTPSSAAKSDGAPHITIVNSLGGTASAVVAKFLAQLGFESSVIGSEGPVSDDVALVDRLAPVRDSDFALVLLPSTGLAAGAGLTTQMLLEIGYLFGALSRDRVLFLVQGTPNVAPDLKDIVRVLPMDGAEFWRLLLAREMRRSGLEVDMNKAV
jgi:hypothetical protein